MRSLTSSVAWAARSQNEMAYRHLLGLEGDKEDVTIEEDEAVEENETSVEEDEAAVEEDDAAIEDSFDSSMLQLNATTLCAASFQSRGIDESRSADATHSNEGGGFATTMEVGALSIFVFVSFSMSSEKASTNRFAPLIARSINW